MFTEITKIEDLEVKLSMNEEFKDEGVKNAVQGIPAYNNLKKLCLDF